MIGYSTRQQAHALARELVALRRSLIRTTFSDLEFANLDRALRVLVLDDDALLMRLAAYFRVQHSVETSPPIRSAPAPGIDPATGSLLMNGMTALISVDSRSRWRVLRGQPIYGGAPLTVSFQDYLDLPVGVHQEHGTEISRKRMLADLANQFFVVHGSTSREKHVTVALLTVVGGPYYISLAQELAVEALIFGEKILRVATERLNIDPLAAQGPGFPEIARPNCDTCHAPVGFADFKCSSGDHEMLGPVRPNNIAQTLTEMLEQSQFDQPGWVVFIGQLPGLAGAGDSVTYADVKGKNRRASLTRTPDRQLVWSVERGGVVMSAVVDLTKRPIVGSPEAFRQVYLCWDFERVTVFLSSEPPDFWATSDGSRPTFFDP